MSDFDTFLDGLKEKAKGTPQLVDAQVELTYGCNLRCVHCYNPTHEAKDELTTDQVLRILDELVEQGCLLVGFTGGELLTRRDAIQVMRYAKQRGLVVNLLTNATMVTPERVEEIKSLDPYCIDVSMYGATAPVYEQVTRVPGSFKKFVRGVDLLIEYRLPVLMKLILMTLNVHEFEAMREFAIQRNVPYKVGTGIHPKVDGSQEPLAYQLPSEQAFEVWRQVSGEKQKRLNGSSSASMEESCSASGALFDCGCGKSSAALTPYGQLNLCTAIHHPLYDLKKGSIAEGWSALVDSVKQTQPGSSYECPECPALVHCDRGAQDGWLEHQAFDGPCISRFRELAEKKVDFLK